ncbi:S-adenosyl-L-methionine-dependent methyltransferase [Pisolithus marmoratus]|nr:S-adenosyl-L-methionine-dependent methyltransferase [Pisolithus marmoratus]
MFSTVVRRASRLTQCTRFIQTNAATSTVNAAEIAHFSRLSSQWWDENGEFALLHRMNPVRVQYIREKLIEIAHEEKGEDVAREMEQRRDSFRGMNMLDVGCGGGLLSESLARLGARTLGIDASESNIHIASMHADADPLLSSASQSGGSLRYQNTSAEELLKEPERFDVVSSMEVIEHVDNPAAFLATCAELVKPGGHLFLSTIARTPLAFLLTIAAAEYVMRKVAIGTHTYSKFINPSELVSFFQTYSSPSASARPWITRTYVGGHPTRTEAEVRGLIYEPWSGNWVLMSRSASQWGAAECNYLFWVRKPLAS